jgi:hypothetical protein
MKIQKRYFLLRIITFPIKLAFSLVWFLLFGIKISVQWLLFGSQELYYGKGLDRESLANFIERVEKQLNEKL